MSRPSLTQPPRWLMWTLAGLAAILLVAYFSQPKPDQPPAQAVLAATPEPTPEPTAEPTPPPPPDYTRPVPLSWPVDGESWFADAAFIGDSRTDGFKLYSGVTPKAAFLDYTGLTVYDAVNGKAVIRAGDSKISILEALSRSQYGKIYIALGVNELGYYDPSDFANTYGLFIDAIRERQPGAILYIQSIIPVNTDKCKANDQPYYVTNENIAKYNEALAAMTAEKEVWLVDVAQALVDASGETPRDLSADGVHFKKEGYALWLNYLTTHTGL